ncbi:DUF2628 domain-containing protein [Crenalkalicoccus roseus]|uniref:DUF2628 domain-containing protein n=1 Tax=Crenalkalicoccus roseus TaxID=1485588 RepID=UPI0010818413|nr:DUF2628 domain-containing protein [Crenalkalicoccus roseus]
MRIWTVHIPQEATGRPRVGSVPAVGAAPPAPDHPPTVPEGAEQAAPPAPDRLPEPPAAPARPVVLVPEGFSWPAFLFNVLWLLWHRLWLAALGYLALAVAIGALLPAGADFAAGLALQFLLGAHAHDLRRRALARRGYAEAHVVAAPDRDSALARLLQLRPELAGPLARTVLA